MASVVSLNPFECRMWHLHDRMEALLNEDSCRAEIESFARHGQLVPVLGRPLQGDLRYRVELVYGARRLFVARHLNKPLLVEMKSLSDREAIIAMDIENRQRTDISPYERGMSYARWLRAGHFGSQEDIAKALKVSASQVSRLLKLTQLPAVIVNAFDSAVSICEGWGLDLMVALDDPKKRERTIQAARTIANSAKRLPPRDVYRYLMSAASSGRRVKSSRHDEVVKDDNGQPLFRIRHHTNSVALVLPIGKTSPEMIERIRESVVEILQTGNTLRMTPRRANSEISVATP